METGSATREPVAQRVDVGKPVYRFVDAALQIEPVDVGERLVGFEEEVARHKGRGDHALDRLDVDGEQLAARDLVFTTHGPEPTESAQVRLR